MVNQAQKGAREGNRYIDTRGQSPKPLEFSEVIIQGLAQGGGLFVPVTLPRLTLDDILDLSQMPYAAQGARIYEHFEVDFAADQIASLMTQAYGRNFDDPAIAPLVSLDEQTHVLELWHGPTAAFKDMALQCLPHFFSAALARQAEAGSPPPDQLILVATSGDTGSSALEGFKDRDHVGIITFYPDGGVSDIQWRQMATAAGSNVGAFGLRGNFDDCQTSVKAAFSDAAFNERLLREHQVSLSSANSINWGRLLPQVVYYVSAYARLVASGRLQAGEELDVCVPTGNFGNILAAWYAREIGTPIGQLYCASNENHVLTDFINTGVYDISQRSFKLTPSPSMDILISSNLERQLFELNGRDPEVICQWMAGLREQGRFEVDSETFDYLQADFRADWVTSDDGLATIRQVYEKYGYLLDPHTAIAYQVAERLRDHKQKPILVVATAHWAKFAANVAKSLLGITVDQDLPAELRDLSGLALNDWLCERYDGLTIPATLAALGDRPVQFSEICDSSTQSVEATVLEWLGRKKI
ncbi:MAG: threonine synthase [Coriobacteriia bacterium]|nr:threonine synthase [Coriobacteriia bacterium]